MKITIDTDEIAKGIGKLVSRAPDRLRNFAGQAGNLAGSFAGQARRQVEEAWTRYRSPGDAAAPDNAPAEDASKEKAGPGNAAAAGRPENSADDGGAPEPSARQKKQETVAIRFNRMSLGAGDDVRAEEWLVPASSSFVEFLGGELMAKLPARPNSFWIVRGTSGGGAYRDLGLVVFGRSGQGRPVSFVGETDVKSLGIVELACISRDGYGEFELGTPEESAAVEKVMADWNS